MDKIELTYKGRYAASYATHDGMVTVGSAPHGETTTKLGALPAVSLRS
jgi:hypothetical protein